MRRALAAHSLLAIVALTAVTPAQAEDILIRAERVLTADGEVLAPGQVLVSDGRIKDVGASIEAGDARVVEAGTLMPGLVDAYSQVGISGQEAEFTREITPELAAAAVLNRDSRQFLEHLSAGTTCLHVAPGTENVISGLSCIVKAGGNPEVIRDRSGLFVTVSNDPASRNRSRSRPDSIYIRQPTNRMGVIWMLRSAFHQAQSANGRGRIATDQGSVNARGLAMAIQGDRPIFGVSRTHYDTLALLNIGGEFGFVPVVIGGQEAWRITDELAAARTTVILTPTAQGASSGQEGTRLCANNAGKLHDAGIPFCFAGGQLLEQARFAVRHGLEPQAALSAVTTGPARVLGLEERLGSIAPGRDADLIALDGDPLEFTTSVDWVMVNGTVQYQAGE